MKCWGEMLLLSRLFDIPCFLFQRNSIGSCFKSFPIKRLVDPARWSLTPCPIFLSVLGHLYQQMTWFSELAFSKFQKSCVFTFFYTSRPHNPTCCFPVVFEGQFHPTTRPPSWGEGEGTCPKYRIFNSEWIYEQGSKNQQEKRFKKITSFFLSINASGDPGQDRSPRDGGSTSVGRHLVPGTSGYLLVTSHPAGIRQRPSPPAARCLGQKAGHLVFLKIPKRHLAFRIFKLHQCRTL